MKRRQLCSPKPPPSQHIPCPKQRTCFQVPPRKKSFENIRLHQTNNQFVILELYERKKPLKYLGCIQRSTISRRNSTTPKDTPCPGQHFQAPKKLHLKRHNNENSYLSDRYIGNPLYIHWMYCNPWSEEVTDLCMKILMFHRALLLFLGLICNSVTWYIKGL